LRALIIPASGEKAWVVDERIDLDYLQNVVGGWIEAVDVEQVLTDSGRRSVNATVFVNEEGKLNGLPVNHRATDLCALAIGGWFHDVIVGDVVVAGQPDDEGETNAVPDALIQIVSEWGWL
jgi:Domain of unknown function (DUF3846)